MSSDIGEQLSGVDFSCYPLCICILTIILNSMLKDIYRKLKISLIYYLPMMRLINEVIFFYIEMVASIFIDGASYLSVEIN
jgi:hypothetical protein